MPRPYVGPQRTPGKDGGVAGDRCVAWKPSTPDQRGLPTRAHMTDSTDVATSTAPAPATAKHTVVVPNSINMVSLLGPGDEHLGLLEQAFEADVHVRGN